MKMFDDPPRLCTCPAGAKSDANGSLNGGKPSEISESKLDQLISLLTVLVEQNDQLISIAIQAPEDEDEPGYGLDGLPITYR